MQTMDGGFEEPGLARWLFGSSAASWIWLVVRVYFGYEWLIAGWERVRDGWLSDNGASLKGFASFALQGAGKGPHSAVNYGWYAAFLRWVVGDGAKILGPVIPIAELSVDALLILGLFTASRRSWPGS